MRRTTRAASDIGLSYLTLFGFSSENWKRPRAEVDYLLDLLRFFIQREVTDLNANKVRIRIMGERQGLPADILKLIADAEALTAGNKGLGLNVAFNYGGQQEIAAAAELVLAEGLTGAAITEAAIGARLWFAGIPDPEIIVRTSGEKRVSNFLLWQAANADSSTPTACGQILGATIWKRRSPSGSSRPA